MRVYLYSAHFDYSMEEKCSPFSLVFSMLCSNFKDMFIGLFFAMSNVYLFYNIQYCTQSDNLENWRDKKTLSLKRM